MAGHWNYRLTVETIGEERVFTIREVHYLDGVGVGWTDPVHVEGDSAEDVAWTLGRMTAALERPLLDLDEQPSGDSA